MDTCIARTGFSHVKAVTYLDNPKGDIMKQLGLVRDNQWVTNIELNVYRATGTIDVELDRMLVCQEPHDLTMPHSEDKLARNSMIGRLVAGSKSGGYTTKYYYCPDERDRDQLIYQFGIDKEAGEIGAYGYGLHNPDGTTYDDDTYAWADHKTTATKNQQYQIHAYMLAYHKTEMMQMVFNNLDCDIVSINVDGIFSRRELVRDQRGNPFVPSKARGQFHYEGMRNLIDVGTKCITPIESPVGITPAPLYSMYADLQSTKTITVSPAGGGKSHVAMIAHPRVDCVFLFPTNFLVSEFRKLTDGRRQCTTYHKYFMIGLSEKTKERVLAKRRVYNNVVIDECTMIPKEHLNTIIQIAQDEYTNVHMLGDMDSDGTVYQRGVSFGESPTQTDWQKWTIVQKIGSIRRQNSADCAILDSLRGLSYSKQLTVLKRHCKTATELPSWEVAPFVGVAVSHKRIYQFNDALVTKEITRGSTVCPARSTKTTRNSKGEYIEINGQIVDRLINSTWFGRKSVNDKMPAGKKYEAAYFRTSDSIQGSAVDAGTPLVIDTKECSADGFLYTAVTRCRRLSDVVLLI